MIHFVVLAKVVHIKTAFWYGKLEEEMYMDAHSLNNVGKVDYIILEQCIHWLMQAARK